MAKNYGVRTCVRCGEEFAARAPNHKRCQACKQTVNRRLVRESCRKWRDRNPERKREDTRRYREENREKVRVFQRAYERRRYRSDPVYRLAKILRARINKALRRGRAGSAVRDLGCSVAQLREHLEARFQPGMSWANQGDWHVDHVRPLSTFDLSNPDQLREACHYTNLQPLWAQQNRRKSNKQVGVLS